MRAGVAGMDLLQGISLVVGITATVGGMIFGLIKFMLVPYLREELVKPLAEAKTLAEATNRQVSVNGNKDPDDPTLKDKVGEVIDEVANLRRATLSIDERLEKYLAWASIEHHRLWDAIRFPHLPPRHEYDVPPDMDTDEDDTHGETHI